MRIGLIPENFSEWLSLKKNLVPYPIFAGMVPLLEIRAVMAAERLGVFRALALQSCDLQKLSKKLDCNEKALESLLNALKGFRYIRFNPKSKYYSLAQNQLKWLDPRSKNYVGHYIQYNYLRWQIIDRLEEFLTIGKSDILNTLLSDKNNREIYVTGLADFLKITIDEILKKIDFNNPKKLLDIGGGNSITGAAFCKKFSDLEVTILDKSEVIEIISQKNSQTEYAQRFQYISGIITEAVLPEEQDVVLLLNILNRYPEKIAESFITRAYASLKTGGKLVIWEPIREEEGGQNSYMGNLTALMFSLAYSSYAFRDSQIKVWLKNALFKKVQKVKLVTVPGVLVYVGTKT